MKTFIEIAGTYHFKSPYHKNKKLPFNIESDGHVSTVEYKGWDAFLRSGRQYSIDNILKMIEDKTIVLGYVPFPKKLIRE